MQLINKNRFCYGVHHINLLSIKQNKEIAHTFWFEFFYNQNFYYDRQNIMDELFHQLNFPLLKDIDHPALVIEWKQNIDYAAYEKITTMK